MGSEREVKIEKERPRKVRWTMPSTSEAKGGRVAREAQAEAWGEGGTFGTAEARGELGQEWSAVPQGPEQLNGMRKRRAVTFG